jgi:hypothetical protein
MTTDRCKLTVLIGDKKERLERAEPGIAMALTRAYGGVTLSFCQGYWARNGYETLSDYHTTDLNAETTLRIELTVLPDLRQEALQLTWRVLRQAAQQHQLAIDNIHVEETMITAHHFRLKTGPQV